MEAMTNVSNTYYIFTPTELLGLEAGFPGYFANSQKRVKNRLNASEVYFLVYGLNPRMSGLSSLLTLMCFGLKFKVASLEIGLKFSFYFQPNSGFCC